jgi:hypothetical protein
VLPASRFVEGINTLTVAIVPGRGPRLERVVSFAVLAAAPATRPKIPPALDKTADLPVPAGMRGFARPAEAVPPAKPTRPAPAPAGWRPPKPARVAKIKDALQRQQHRSQKTVAALSKRVELVRSRAVPAKPSKTETPEVKSAEPVSPRQIG